MKENHKFRVKPDGTIETIYDDELVPLAKEMGADLAQVCRASSVEFEIIGRRKGWSVRAAHDDELAIRFSEGTYGVSKFGIICLFESRQEALKEEVKFFWQLLPKKEEKANAG